MRISVVIPVYNAYPFLEKAVMSALQFYEVKEVVLVEDCSTDNSLEVCRQLTEMDKRVILYQHPDKKNHGAPASMSLGLKMATMDYLCILGADDFYLPNRFDLDKLIFEKYPEADGTCSAIGSFFYSEEAKEQYLKNKKEITTYDRPDLSPENYFETIVLHKGFTSLDGITLKRSCIDKIGYLDETLLQSQDTDYILRLALHCKIYPASMKEPVCLRGVHENNRIHNIKEAKRFGGLLYLKWLKISVQNNWSNEINLKIFYRAVVGYSTNYNLSRNKAALKLIVRHPKILSKIKIKDLMSIFKNKFK
jgi:glycosyltransferase involved in cell wall biosynthesis